MGDRIGEIGRKSKDRYSNVLPFRAPGVKHELTPESYKLSGSELLKHILDLENPKKVIQKLPLQDFYWLIKKIGEDDCLPVLELGTREQWQHVMDLEIWQKDRLDMSEAFRWLQRLQLADGVELAKWLFSDAQHFAYYYFFRSVQVEILKHDDPNDLPDGFFTLDGVIYIRAKDQDQRETLEKILRAMAQLDFERYQNFLLGLSGVLPAELEEELFRRRNVRLAEHGFLPFDEAFSVYAALPADALTRPVAKTSSDLLEEEDIRPLIPMAPLHHAHGETLLAQITSNIDDPLFMDRLRLEFAGLCNQILSAEGLNIKDFDTLVKTCRRAAAYLNVALEKASGQDIERATHVLKENILLTVFRVGFGYALRLKWDTDRWVKESWFKKMGFSPGFWGDEWGGTLEGILQKKPLYYTGYEEEEFRDFEKYSEIEKARLISERLKALDKLLQKISEKYAVEKELPVEPDITFYMVLFTVWASHMLGYPPSVAPLSLDDIKRLFVKLRKDDSSAPYNMEGFKESFIGFFISEAAGLPPGETAILTETLSRVWEQFREEYEWVEIENLDSRFSRFVRIKHAP